MRAVIVGAGVIGRGWAVRFAAFGWNVTIYDADADAASRAQRLLQQVRPQLRGLYEQLPDPGQINQCTSLESAFPNDAQVDWVQESLPENLSIKRKLYEELAPLLGDAPLCSSTSGFKPSDLAAATDSWTQSLVVVHPFNPVYLLPLAEVVPASGVAPTKVATVMQTLRDVGMHPLRVQKEIDAHIADRLLEAVWREALWLVKDGVATTEDIDTAITHGFGLRWAQMGLFETYRLGGGDAGMAHFLAQFGPALQWPWSRLTDVPELDSTLIEQIVTQSDAQSGEYSLEALTTHRDENLVALLQALKSKNWAAGQVFNNYRAPMPVSKKES